MKYLYNLFTHNLKLIKIFFLSIPLLYVNFIIYNDNNTIKNMNNTIKNMNNTLINNTLMNNMKMNQSFCLDYSLFYGVQMKEKNLYFTEKYINKELFYEKHSKYNIGITYDMRY